MSEQEESRECLGLAFEHLKALHVTVASLMVDVAALRQIVLKNRKKSGQDRLTIRDKARVAKPRVALAVQAYEEAFSHVISDGALKN